MVKQVPPRDQTTNTRAVKKPVKTGSKTRALDKGRPTAQQTISTDKIRALLEKPLFYHHHRISLIKANMKQYYVDSQTQIYEYIGRKQKGQIKLQCFKKLFNKINVDDLNSSFFKKLYSQKSLITMKVFDTNIEEVNSKSKMEKWAQDFKLKLENQLNQQLQIVSQKFPQVDRVEEMIIKEIYCMLARYFHFEVNICDSDKEEKQENENSSI